MAIQVQERKQSLWDTPLNALVTINWDVVILVAILALAVVTRFYDLGSAAWSHDEAIHTDWSNKLYTGQGYIHNPIYHGPLLYHMTALAFFLLGANDFSARTMPVLFGLVLIAAPFLFRHWLGKRGWIVTSVMFFISPVIAAYSRVDRHDIYVEACVVLIALAILKYLTTRRANWLYFASAMLAFSFTAMETTFIFMALFGYFLGTVFTYDYFNKRTPRAKTTNALLAVVLGLPFTVVAIAMFLIEKYTGRNGDTREDARVAEPSAFDAPSFDLLLVFGTFIVPLGLTPLFIKYVLQRDPTDYSSVLSISTSSGALILFLVLTSVVGLLWNWRKWAICAALFYPIMLVFFTTVFTNPAGIGSGFVGSLGYWLSQQSVQRGSQPQYYYLLVTMPLYEYLPYLFGMLGIFYILIRRSGRRALIFGAALAALFALEFYLWFTPGVIDAIKTFPGFRGLDNLQAANRTVLLLGVLLPLFAGLSYDPEDESTRFPTLIGIWALGVLVLFSWAGEKMPWLNMHLSIPLAVVSGYFMNDVLSADWRDLAKRGAVLMAIVMTLGLLVLAFQFFFGPAPLSGTPLDDLAQRSSTIIAIVVIGACAGLAVYYGLALGWKNAVRVVLVTVFAILSLFTIRTMASAAYYNKDMATETIVYAQGTPDVPNTMREIEELSRRLCAQTNTDSKVKLNCDNGKVKVAYDDDSAWPFSWYLRDYRNAQFYGKSPGGPFDAEVVIVGDANESAVKPFLGNRYIKREMRLVWWPDESYKDLNWAKLFGGTDENGNVIPGVLQPANFQKLVRDLWFFHKYENSLNSWPFVHRFSLYVRKDVAGLLWQYAGIAPAATVNEPDPYLDKYIQNLQAQAVVTSSNEMNGPKNMAFAPDGSMYVLDTNNHRVQVFDASRNFVKMFGTQGSGPGQFNEPWGIAIAQDGTVYIADTWNHRIQKLDKDGNFLAQWGTFGDVGTSFDQELLQLYGPRAVAIDKNGNVWVADTGNERITEFSPNGEPLTSFGGTGGEVGQFLEPVGLTIDKEGNFYVADTWNRRIQVFDSKLQPVRQIDVQAWDSQSVVNKPYIAVDTERNIYVTDPEGFRIIKYSNDGKVRAVWGLPGGDLSQMQLPTGITFDAAGNIVVADSGNNRLLIFAPVQK